MNVQKMTELIHVARGEKEADLVLKGAKIVDVLTGEIYSGDVAIYEDLIAGIGDYSASNQVNLDGGYLIPGLIDGHVHIESSMVAPPQYARGVLPKGTTAVFADPHEIANVMGVEGIDLMLQTSENIPLSVFIMASSCVPATHMETSGANIDAETISQILKKDRVVGLAEMMNYTGVIFGDPSVLAKLAVSSNGVIDGHAPGLTGKDLQAYAAAGIDSDHECTTPDEAREKLRAGMVIMIREGTGARNLDDLLPIVTTENHRRIIFCSDDLHPPELINRGHIDYMVRRAIEFGIDPIIAIRMATINAAEYFRQYNMGAIAPGKVANIIWSKDLTDFNPRMVWAKGKLIAKDGKITDNSWTTTDINIPNTMNSAPLSESKLQIRAKEGDSANVIQLIKNQLVTEKLVEKLKIVDGCAVSDIDRDILKMAVIERHNATGNIGLGFIKGFGLKEGAIASSVGHDSHNLIVVGTNDSDMIAAAEAVIDSKGGFSAVKDGVVVGSLALEFGGLMSLDTIDTIKEKLDEIKINSRILGSKLDDPFMTLGFMALPVIPKLKLTDKGLVDVEQFKIIDLLVE